MLRCPPQQILRLVGPRRYWAIKALLACSDLGMHANDQGPLTHLRLDIA